MNSLIQILSQPSWAAWIEIQNRSCFGVSFAMSQPSWAAWIEIFSTFASNEAISSQPSWAAWIEIGIISGDCLTTSCRSPLGLRGLKLRRGDYLPVLDQGRSPLGLRGLKLPRLSAHSVKVTSQPSWAAWIEILSSLPQCLLQARRSPLGLRGLK